MGHFSESFPITPRRSISSCSCWSREFAGRGLEGPSSQQMLGLKKPHLKFIYTALVFLLCVRMPLLNGLYFVFQS